MPERIYLNLEFGCPICTEIPEGEIYQCINGHIICRACLSNLWQCPQCREPYGNKKIRNRALEQIIRARIVECSNKSFGCMETVPQKDLATHLHICAFRPRKVSICKHMGYSCEYETDSGNIPNAILHFLVEHNAVHVESCYEKILLAGFPCTNRQPLGIWSPFILEKDSTHFLVFAKFNNISQSLSFNCIHLRHCSEIKKDFTVKFTVFIKKTQFMEYTMSPVSLTDVKKFLLTPHVQISEHFLNISNAVDQNLLFVVWIQSSVNEIPPDVSSINDNDPWFAIWEKQTEQDFSNNNDCQPTAHYVKCKCCYMKPIMGEYRHRHCLEREDIDLCSRCHNRKVVHSFHHWYTTIKAGLQHRALNKLRRREFLWELCAIVMFVIVMYMLIGKFHG